MSLSLSLFVYFSISVLSIVCSCGFLYQQHMFQLVSVCGLYYYDFISCFLYGASLNVHTIIMHNVLCILSLSLPLSLSPSLSIRNHGMRLTRLQRQ